MQKPVYLASDGQLSKLNVGGASSNGPPVIAT